MFPMFRIRTTRSKWGKGQPAPAVAGRLALTNAAEATCNQSLNFRPDHQVSNQPGQLQLGPWRVAAATPFDRVIETSPTGS